MQPHTERNGKKDTPRINPRNVPVHIVFWLFVILAFYAFYKAFA